MEHIVIANVSSSYFSMARHTGAVKINGKIYQYCPIRDILVREDWAKAYRTLGYNEFLEAVRLGKMPEMQKRNNRPTKTEHPSLFD